MQFRSKVKKRRRKPEQETAPEDELCLGNLDDKTRRRQARRSPGITFSVLLFSLYFSLTWIIEPRTPSVAPTPTPTATPETIVWEDSEQPIGNPDSPSIDYSSFEYSDSAGAESDYSYDYHGNAPAPSSRKRYRNPNKPAVVISGTAVSDHRVQQWIRSGRAQQQRDGSYCSKTTKGYRVKKIGGTWYLLAD